MELTPQQRRQLLQDGFSVLPNAVPPELIHAALRAINSSMGEGMPADQMATLRARSYCPELRDQPVATDLFNASSLRSLAEAAIGKDAVAPVTAAQIALRFPTTSDDPGEAQPHVDG